MTNQASGYCVSGWPQRVNSSGTPIPLSREIAAQIEAFMKETLTFAGTEGEASGEACFCADERKRGRRPRFPLLKRTVFGKGSVTLVSLPFLQLTSVEAAVPNEQTSRSRSR